MSTKIKHQMPQQPANTKESISDPDFNKNESTANKLLKFAGTWQGNDLEKCLEEVYKTRGETTF